MKNWLEEISIKDIDTISKTVIRLFDWSKQPIDFLFYRL